MRRPSARVAVLAAAALTAGLAGLTAPAAAAAPVAAVPLVPAPGVESPPVDVATLDMVPTPTAGLVLPDPGRTQTPTIASTVWALRQAGTRMFAGGMFTAVQADATATPVTQPFLAAFDVATGRFDSTCRPVFDNAVYSLAVLPSGMLAVGGEFTTVNGAPRAGLVVLDPATCQVVTSFPTEVGRPYSTLRPIVRALQVVGGKLYLAGNFSRITRPGTGVTAAAPPADATACATEGGTCAVPSGRTADVWYGAGTRWTQRSTAFGQVACTTATFGDPAPGTVKSCRYRLDGGRSVSIYKVARVDGTTGAIDTAFRPRVTGSSVWDLAVDDARGQVHLAGWFSGVAGAAGTANYATVDTTTGALVPGLAALPRNSTAQTDAYTVTMGAPDRVFFGGSEHILQMLDAGTGTQLGYAHTGYRGCADPFYVCGFFGGGDYQVAEKIGDHVFAGCHCNVDHSGTQLSHYSSLTGQYTAHKFLMAYDASTERLVDGFRPDIDGAVEGSWAVASDTLGCLYIGGDYTKGGLRAGRKTWLSGVARLCPTSTTPPPPPPPATDTTAPTAPTAVQATDVGGGLAQVSWNAAKDAVGVDHYHVVAPGGAAVDVPTAPATLTGLPAGTATFTVTAVDAAGNSGPPATATATLGRAGADTASPTAPTGLGVAQAGGGAALTWTASTDGVGVRSYLVYRNGAYVGWSATTTWTDANAPRGSTLEYRLRATDAAGNNSVKSAPVAVTLP